MITTKFRVFDGNKMIYVANKQNDTSIIFNEWGWEVVDHLRGEIESLIRSWENKKTVLMQSIGLLDKKGKEIYEGDILVFHHGHGDRFYKVFCVPGGFAINAFPNDVNKEEIAFHEGTSDMQTSSFIESNCEVIGNICEYPELLNSN